MNSMCYINAEIINQIMDVRSLAHLLRLEYTLGLSEITIPQRLSIVRERPYAVFNAMPAYSERHQLFITKIGAVVPKTDINSRSVHAVVTAFSGKTGKPLALIDGDAITNLKCAAVSALVTDCCASEEAKIMALIGSGVQAREQIRGVCAVRNLEKIKIYSRNKDRVLRFIYENAPLCSNTELVLCSSAEEAVADADIISTATTSADPIISETVLEKKAIHINCMGNHTPQSRELPISTLQQCILIVEDIATAVAEAGEVHSSAITIEQLIRLNSFELKQQRTIFASTGHAFLDLITISYVLAALEIQH